jgi:hypothetical protein
MPTFSGSELVSNQLSNDEQQRRTTPDTEPQASQAPKHATARAGKTGTAARKQAAAA